MSTTKTALIFIAVSSPEQAKVDKVSLAEQEALCRNWCAANGYTVVELLSVPGYSRSESDVITALEEFAAQGITAYQKLRDYWRRGGVDALVCYHDSRLGRSASLYTWVLENTIRAGIAIYRIQGGWITSADMRMQNAMGIIAATTDTDRLQAGFKAGMKARAARGLPLASKAPISHRVVRDELGGAVRFELREGLDRLWSDLAAAFLGGVSYAMLERVLFEQYGHVDPRTGKPFSNLYFNHLLHTPVFWGNNAQYRFAVKLKPLELYGAWTFDSRYPAPDGVDVYYNVLPAVYTGELAERVKAEMHRRKEMVGKRRPGNTKRFSGLLICGCCSYTMNYNSKPSGWTIYRCVTHLKGRGQQTACACMPRSIHTDAVQEYIDGILRQMLAHGSVDYLRAVTRPPDVSARVGQLEAEMAALSTERRALMRLQAKASTPREEADYDAEIKALSARETILESQLTTLRQQLRRFDTPTQDAALARLGVIGVDELWKKPDVEIHQWLLEIFGDWRFTVYNGEMSGFVPKPDYFRKGG